MGALGSTRIMSLAGSISGQTDDPFSSLIVWGIHSSTMCSGRIMLLVEHYLNFPKFNDLST